MQEELQHKLSIVLLFAFCAALVFRLNGRIDNAPNSSDAAQNLRLAYNLAYHGRFSQSTNPNNLAPSYHREPLPVLGIAVWTALHPELRNGLNHPSATVSPTINEGEAVRLVKQSNLIWAFLTLFGVGMLVLVSLPKQYLIAVVAAMLATYLVLLLYVEQNGIINRLTTEIQASALIVWLGYALIVALQTQRKRALIIAGVLVGCLALTKASFFYVGIVMMGLLALVYGIKIPIGWTRRDVVRSIVTLTAAFALTTAPWIIRNNAVFGDPAIVSRGGLVLYTRVVKNQMDIPGGFYYYAPRHLKPILGDWLGYTPEDLELGGRLQGLNRDGSASFAESDLMLANQGQVEGVISYYRQARATHAMLVAMYREQGAKDPTTLTDIELQRLSLEAIRKTPLRHLETTFVFMWRGMWSMGAPVSIRLTNPYAVVFWVNGLAFLSMWAFFCVGLWRRNAVMLGVSLVSALGFGFFALLSHFIPRYSAPMIPSMIVSLVLVGAWGIIYLVERVKTWRLDKDR